MRFPSMPAQLRDTKQVSKVQCHKPLMDILRWDAVKLLGEERESYGYTYPMGIVEDVVRVAARQLVINPERRCRTIAREPVDRNPLEHYATS